MVQRQQTACLRPAPARQRGAAVPERRVPSLSVRRRAPPSPCEQRLRVSTRAGVPALMRRSVSTPRRRSSRLTTGALKTWCHGRRRGRPPCPVGPGARQVSRMARIEDTKPSGQTNSAGRAAPARSVTGLQSRPTEFLDFTNLTREEFQQLVPPFEATF
jgi:hypothetical protein